MRNDFIEHVLEHSAKGTAWKNTKYLKKVPLGNNKFYYIYTQAQLNAWNKRHSGSASNVLSNKEKESRVKTAASGASIETLAKNGFKVKGSTIQEKTANLNLAIQAGTAKINQVLNKAKKTEEAKTNDNSSSKKSSGGSGGSSKKSSGSKAKGGSSGSSKSKGSSASKDKEGKSGSSKATSKSSEVKKAAEKTTNSAAPITLDALKKIYGKEDKDVTTHTTSPSEFKETMLSKYKDGSYGYLMAGGKAYKWTIDGGKLILKDYDTDKEVSFDDYLKNAKEFKEFQTNTKKKN